MEDDGRTGREVNMAGKLSPKARMRLGVLEEARRKWDHVHSLVERLVSAKEDHHHLKNQISRASLAVGRLLADNGLPVIAEDVDQIAGLIRQGGPIERKFTRMRELVGRVRTGMELAESVTRKQG